MWPALVFFLLAVLAHLEHVTPQTSCGHPRFTDVLLLTNQFRGRTANSLLQTIIDRLVLESKANGTGDGKIVGGVDVTDRTGGLLCWQVAIQLKSLPGLVRCGGTIIGSRTILTAGHCVISNRGGQIRPANIFSVVVGALDSSFSGSDPSHGASNCGRTFDVAKVTLHPDFNRVSLNGDVALLTLSEDINLSAPCTCAICLASRMPLVSEWCVNSGYGQESESAETDRKPTPLKYIYQQILQNFVDPKCRYENGVDGTSFICAGGVLGTDNCYGDSGGPLVCHNPKLNAYYQAGIVSYGPGTCGDGQGSRYTSVPKYLNWIISNSGNNAQLA